MKDLIYSVKRFFRNLRHYWKILLTDENFDFYFLENLIQQKMFLMKNFFESPSMFLHNTKNVIKEIDLTIKIGKIFIDSEEFGEFYSLSREDGSIYVNIKNYKRFIPYPRQKCYNDLFNDENKTIKCLVLEELRREKARYIFYKRLYQYAEGWWD